MGSSQAYGQADLYVPRPAYIESVRQLTKAERLFRIRLEDDKWSGHEPGQFVQVSIFGAGEAPFSICSAAEAVKDGFELCIRRIGSVTGVLHLLGEGARISVRGPYGHGFDLDVLAGRDVLFIAGGIGLAPLRSLIQHCLVHKSDFGSLTLLYGAKNPGEMLFRDEFDKWAVDGFTVHLTVDAARPEDGWIGNVGLITTLIGPIEIDPERTIAVIVGPPIMYKFVIKELAKKRLPPERIMVSLERMMRCGVGKCGHCAIGNLYCCIDGPVFMLDKIQSIQGAI